MHGTILQQLTSFTHKYHIKFSFMFIFICFFVYLYSNTHVIHIPQIYHTNTNGLNEQNVDILIDFDKILRQRKFSFFILQLLLRLLSHKINPLPFLKVASTFLDGRYQFLDIECWISRGQICTAPWICSFFWIVGSFHRNKDTI